MEERFVRSNEEILFVKSKISGSLGESLGEIY